ncbi:MAG: hypothetical protein M3220_12235, partial [Chloroflexota bacterium]|nr:hypothetical protein [Chloroflexota bacterium]
VEGGKSQARNPLLSRALRLIGFAELAGSGLRALRDAWRSEKRRPPRAESDEANNTFTLTLDWRPLTEIKDPLWHTRLGLSLTQQEADALQLTFEPDGASVQEIASALGIPLEDAQAITKRLIREQLVDEQDNHLYIVDRLRDVPLLGEFEAYRESTAYRLDDAKPEVLRAGFRHAWENSDYQTILDVANKLPRRLISNDPFLQRYVDLARLRTE